MTDNRLPLPTYRASGRRVRADATPPVMTSGQVAQACGVAPRTVTKWIDGGLLSGYRIPGSNDRRVAASDVVVFMRRSGIPVPRPLALLVAPFTATVCWGLDATDPRPPDATVASDPFALGGIVATARVLSALIGDSEGVTAATAAARCVRGAHPAARLVLLTGPDVGAKPGDLWAAVLTRPATLGQVIKALEGV